MNIFGTSNFEWILNLTRLHDLSVSHEKIPDALSAASELTKGIAAKSDVIPLRHTLYIGAYICGFLSSVYWI